MSNAAIRERTQPSINELRAMARADFWCFVEIFFEVLKPSTKLVYAPYLKLITILLMAVAAGTTPELILNLPPRHMKSMLASVFYVAWRLACDPTAKFIAVSYGDDLAHEHSSSTRKVMQSPLYRELFPGTVLDKAAVDHIRTTKGGARYSTSVGSDITGFGAHEIIIDDPMQPEDASSEGVKQKLREWIFNSVLTRFDPGAVPRLVLVMHRLAPDDLSATLEEVRKPFVLRLPLIAEAYECYEDGEERVVFERDVGERLNPHLMKPADVDKLRLLPGYVWDAQYQQRPTVGGSGMLDIGCFRRFDLARSPKCELTIHSWDVGATVAGNASVCTKWGLRVDPKVGDVLYLIDVIRMQIQLPEVRAVVRSQNDADLPALIIVDERGVGMGLYQELQRQGLWHVMGAGTMPEPITREGDVGLRPGASKIDRFGKASLLIADGRVLIPNEAKWLDRFLREVAAFPNIADKDQVDSMTQLLSNFGVAIRKARLFKDRQSR